MSSADPPAPTAPRFCAVFVDFENVYYTLLNQLAPGPESALDQAIELLSNLRRHLQDVFGYTMAVGRSYGDFDRIGGAQGQLQFLGFDPRFMIATAHKNSSDILLSIDAMEILLARPELDMFVIVGGDRDYLPIVLRMRERLKHVLVVGFPTATSGDLRVVVGEENFVRADSLLPHPAPAPAPAPQPAAPAPAAVPAAPAPALHPRPSVAAEAPVLSAKDEEETMQELILTSYRHGEVVWLGPFLRTLNDKLPHLDNRGRKELLNRLVAREAIEIIRLDGVQGPYSAVRINWNDPWVQEVAPGPG